MSDNLNEKYDKIIEFLYNISSEFCDEFKIQIKIEILKEDILNAGVKHVEDNIYCINIYSGCLNLDYRIEEITKRYKEDDLLFFGRVKGLRLFECYENDTYREELSNLFGSVILLHIFAHECGHIWAKHVESTKGMYEEYDSTLKGNYKRQEREMVADWLGTKFVYPSIFHALVKYNNPDTEEIIRILRQIAILYWLSLTIEFQIFDSNHMKRTDDFSTLTHPHPAVRLHYSIEAMRECMVDILNEYELNDDQAEALANDIIADLYIFVKSFLGITDTPIDIKKNDPQIIDCYIKLREVPYRSDVEKNNYFHLEPMAYEYRSAYEEYLDLIRKQIL